MCLAWIAVQRQSRFRPDDFDSIEKLRRTGRKDRSKSRCQSIQYVRTSQVEITVPSAHCSQSQYPIPILYARELALGFGRRSFVVWSLAKTPEHRPVVLRSAAYGSTAPGQQRL